MAIVIVNDATHGNIGALPKWQTAAGYSTGSGDVPWTAADWVAHPGAVRIDQSPDGHDTTADVYDVEDRAGTVARSAGWAKAALASYQAAVRPGQRSPAIYLNLFNVTPVANALIAGGITSGVGLWLANWNDNETVAAAQVLAGNGPFPVIGVQFHNAGAYDLSVFSSTWLAAVSGKSGPAAPSAPVARPVAGPVAGPVAAPVAGQLPTPTALAIDRTRLALGWHAVTGPGLTGYTVAATGLNGKEYARTTTPITQPWCVLNGLVPGWTYTVRVWPNGGAVAPKAALLTVTLPALGLGIRCLW